MRIFIATAFLVLGLLSTPIVAQATDYPGYPDWARDAFERPSF